MAAQRNSRARRPVNIKVNKDMYVGVVATFRTACQALSSANFAMLRRDWSCLRALADTSSNKEG